MNNYHFNSKENIIKNSANILNFILNETPFHVFLKDLDGHYIQVNPYFEKSIGKTKEEIVGFTDFDLFSKEDAGLLIKNDRHVIDTGEVLITEEKLFFNNDTSYFLSTKFPLLNEDQDITGICGIAFDITASKKIEYALRESENKFRKIVSNSQALIFILDSEGYFEFIEGKILNHYDITAREIIGQSIYKLLGPTSESALCFEKALAGASFSKTLNYKDISFNVFYSPHQDGDGNIIGVLGLAIDISARVQTERKLIESEARLRSFFEFSPDAIFIEDKDGTILDCNQAALQMMGYAREELLAMKAIDLIPAEYREQFFKMTSDFTPFTVMSSEFVNQRKNGEIFPVEIKSGHIKINNEERFLISIRDISIKKETEEKLQESRELFSAFMEYLPALVFIKDENKNFIYTNNYMNKLFNSNKLIGKNLSHIFPPEVSKLKNDDDLKALEKGYIKNIETFYNDTGKKTVTFETHKFIIKNHNKPPYIGGIGLDISEKVKAEQELAGYLFFLKNLDRINQILQKPLSLGSMINDLLNELLSIFNCDRAWLLHPCDPESEFWSIAYQQTRPNYADIPDDKKLFDMTPEISEFFKKSIEDGDTLKMINNQTSGILLQISKKYSIKAQMSFPIKPKLGKPWILGLHHCQYRHNFSYEETQLFKKIALRISDSFSSLLILRDLQEREERLRSVFEAAENVAFISICLTPHIEIEELSKGAESIFGLTKDDFGIQPLTLICEKDNELEFEQILNDITQNKKGFSGEMTLHRKSGQCFPALVTIHPIFDITDEIFKVLLVAIDISERKNAEQEREKIKKQLFQAQKMESIGKLAGGVAHDFNNLLTVISGYSELIKVDPTTNESTQEKAQQILNAAQKASSLTSQLLAFSRKQILQSTRVNLSYQVGNLTKMLKRLIGEDIILEAILEPDVWPIEADPTQIDQVIMNLTINARDAIPNGGVITIQLENMEIDKYLLKEHSYAVEGKYVCLSVTDNGIGMNKETIAKIFEPFFTTKAVGEGTGLGLAMVYGVVTQHKGWVSVYSEPGLGATFKVYLPAIDKETEPEETVDNNNNIFSGNGELILLIEDEIPLQELTNNILLKTGYKVITAGNTAAAMELFHKHLSEINLVFSDIVLPDGNGIDLVEKIKNTSPDMKVLLSSGYVDKKARWELIQERNYPFIEKPYVLNNLLTVVRDILAD